MLEVIVNGSSSKGNNYILVDGESSLMLEAGIKFKEVLKSGASLKNVVGLLVTHEHGDHIKHTNDILASVSFDMYATQGTIEAGIDKGFLSDRAKYRYKAIEVGKQFMLGGWKIIAFDVNHDVAEPVGYLIESPSKERIVFITDTIYCPVKFPSGITHWLVECNHSVDILDENVEQGIILPFLRDRIIKSHMNLETCKDFFRNNDLTSAKQILLLHLSGENSDPQRFKQELEEVIGKTVEIARRKK
ncbi:MBL fold metallo-hydrolase [Vagococcus fluvialis]|jgi:phosphoribosyl 1,2-cyclic phosphodiesterase|uniref:MBL fold metallo-hydrolase n=1 Tax=Vagococcus fluvialis TaxID=2738 RepID=UPI001A8F0A72|nr:MBL fold metallo-hydrolase [Vagococcus fluvialis]MBO0430458.1 MBL fold metallo-hydrolase [Vagococcus fluvialis]